MKALKSIIPCLCLLLLSGIWDNSFSAGDDLPYFNEAMKKFEKGDYYNAKKDFVRFLNTKPSRGGDAYKKTLYHLGLVNDSLTNYTEALEFYKLYEKVAGSTPELKEKISQAEAKVNKDKSDSVAHNKKVQEDIDRVFKEIEARRPVNKKTRSEYTKDWEEAQKEAPSKKREKQSSADDEFSPREIITRSKAAVVEVLCGRSGGTGFIITKNGFILTNIHVIDCKENIKVKLLSGDQYEAEVVGRQKPDIALIKIREKDLPLLELRGEPISDVDFGKRVVAIGHPGGGGKFSITEGLISSYLFEGGYNWIQTDAKVNPGNSGGPLIGPDGKVVGIITRKKISIASGGKDIPLEGISFAIPSSLVVSWLKAGTFITE